TLEDQRMLLFYPTGKGKTKTSLGLLAARGWTRAVVVAPPRTHDDWIEDSRVLGIDLVIMSVEKFRQKGTALSKGVPLVVDEVHLAGRHNSVGFKKLSRMATHFPAIILASATPQYNDPERVYCIAVVLRPSENRGGFLSWVYKHCETSVNPFAI